MRHREADGGPGSTVVPRSTCRSGPLHRRLRSLGGLARPTVVLLQYLLLLLCVGRTAAKPHRKFPVPAIMMRLYTYDHLPF